MTARAGFSAEDAAAPQAPRPLPHAKSRLKAVTGDQWKKDGGGGDASTAWIAAAGVLVVGVVAGVVFGLRRRRARAAEAAADAAARAAAAVPAPTKPPSVSFVAAAPSLDAQVAAWAEAEVAAAAGDALPTDLARVTAGTTALYVAPGPEGVLRIPVVVEAVDRNGATLASEIDLGAAPVGHESLLVVDDEAAGARAFPVARVASSRVSAGRIRVLPTGVGASYPSDRRRAVACPALIAPEAGGEIPCETSELGVGGLTAETSAPPPAGARCDVYLRLDDGEPDQIAAEVRSVVAGADGGPSTVEIAFLAVGSETKAKLVEHLARSAAATS